MKVKRNGRITEHVVTLDVEKAPSFSNVATRTVVWPYSATIVYQYSWTDGAWHVLNLEIKAYRNPEHVGNDVRFRLWKPDNWPAWIGEYITANTPAALADPEMVR